MKYNIAEIFASINGEGPFAGEPAVFVRLMGCNMRCSYCDTAWALSGAPQFVMTEDETVQKILSYGISRVTLTGGEPLLAKNVDTLIKRICLEKSLKLEIETNGSIPIRPYFDIENGPVMTVDYKLPSSGCEEAMYLGNFEDVRPCDSVKFVCSDKNDLIKGLEIINRYSLRGRCNIFFSPVWGMADPKEMVAFLLENRLSDVRLALQLHKFIWDPNERGV